MATEFVMLVIEKSMAEMSQDDGQRRKSLTVENIFADFDREGLLVKVSNNNTEALSTDGQPFFDADRHRMVEETILQAIAKALQVKATACRRIQAGAENITGGQSFPGAGPDINTQSGMLARDPLALTRYTLAVYQVRRVE